MLFKSETKLIVMSATLQGDLFTQYFSEALKVQPENPIKPIFVGVKNFLVEEIFLEDIPKRFDLSSFARKATARAVANFTRKLKLPDESTVSRSVIKAEVKPNLFELCRDLISMSAQGGKTILIFLPGLNEIEDILDVIHVLENGISGVKIKLSALHSSLSQEELQDAFEKPDIDTCQIVLATNIAESSVTLPEVNYVIDFGLQKELFYDLSRKMCCLRLRWCSHAAAQQRAGRTGRVCPGKVIRLYTKQFFDEAMPKFDPPEMEQAPLDKLVLKAKYLIKHTFPGTGLKELLSKVIQPPEVSQVDHALELLANLGALSENSEDASVTLLGNIVTSLPIDVNFGRLVVFGALFGMTCDAVVMAASLSSQTPFSIISKAIFQTTELFALKAKEFLKTRLRYDNEEFSEPIMVRNLFIDWLKYKIDNVRKHHGQNYALAKEFCTGKAVIPKRLLNLEVQVLEMLRRTEQFIRESSDVYLVRALIKLLGRKQHNEQTYTGTQGDLIEEQNKHEDPKIKSVLRTRRKQETSKSIRGPVDSDDHTSHSEPLANGICNYDGLSDDSTFRGHNFVRADHRMSVNVSANFKLDRSENVSQLFCQDPCMLKALLTASFPQNIVTGKSCYLLEEKKYQNSEKRGTTQNYGAKVLMEDNGFNPKKSVELIIKNGVKPEDVVDKLKEMINISKSEVLGDIVLIEFDDILGNMDFFDERVFKDEKGFTHVILDRPIQNLHTVPYSSYILNMLGSGRNRFSITSLHPGGSKDHSDRYIEGPLQPYLIKWISCFVPKQGVPYVNGKQEWRSPGGFLCDTRDTTNGVLAVVPSIVGTHNPKFAWFDGLTLLPTAANGCLTWILLLCFLPDRQVAVYHDIDTGAIYGLRVLNKELMLSFTDNAILHLGDLTPIYAIREEFQKQLCGGEGINIAKSNVKEMLNKIIVEIKDRASESKEAKSKWQKKRKKWFELSNRLVGEEDCSSALLELNEQSEGQRLIPGHFSGGQNSEESKIETRKCCGDQSDLITLSTVINMPDSSCNIAVENVTLYYLCNESSQINSKGASCQDLAKKNSIVESRKDKENNEDQRGELKESEANEKDGQLSTESFTVDSSFCNSEELVVPDVAIDIKKSKRSRRRRKKSNGNQVNQSETKEGQEEKDPFLTKLLEIMQYSEEKFTLKQLQKGMGKFSKSLTLNNLLKYSGIIRIENINDHWFVSLKHQDDLETIKEENSISCNEEEKAIGMNKEDEKVVGRIFDTQDVDQVNVINLQRKEQVIKDDNQCGETVDENLVDRSKYSEDNMNKNDMTTREQGKSDRGMIDYNVACGGKQTEHQSVVNPLQFMKFNEENTISLNEEDKDRARDREDEKEVQRVIDSRDQGNLMNWQENGQVSKAYNKCEETFDKSSVKHFRDNMGHNEMNIREHGQSEDMIDYSAAGGGKQIDHQSEANLVQCKKLSKGNSISLNKEDKGRALDREVEKEGRRTIASRDQGNLMYLQDNEQVSKDNNECEETVDENTVNISGDNTNENDMKIKEHGQSDEDTIEYSVASGRKQTDHQSDANHLQYEKLREGNCISLNDESKGRAIDREVEKEGRRTIDSGGQGNLMYLQENKQVRKNDNECEETSDESLPKYSDDTVNKHDLKKRKNGQNDEDMIDYSAASGEKEIEYQSVESYVHCERLHDIETKRVVISGDVPEKIMDFKKCDPMEAGVEFSSCLKVRYDSLISIGSTVHFYLLVPHLVLVDT